VATCAECAFDWECAPTALVEDLRDGADLQIPVDDPRIRVRPQPDVWSALEYTAHLRDVLRFYDDRIERTLTEVRPQLTAFGFHDACERLGYNAEPAAETLQQLHREGQALADRVNGLDATQWDRVAIGSGGDERSVLRLARSAAHEVRHHALDIRRVLARVDGSRHAH
jgi:hypothetical protein